MPGKAWTADKKIRIVLESLNTDFSLAELCRKYSMNPGVFYQVGLTPLGIYSPQPTSLGDDLNSANPEHHRDSPVIV